MRIPAHTSALLPQPLDSQPPLISQYLRHYAPDPSHSPPPPARALRDTVFPVRLIGNTKFISYLEICGITRFTSTQPTAAEPQPTISSFQSDWKLPSGFPFNRQLHRPGGASVSEGPGAAMPARHLPPPWPIVVDSIAAGTSHLAHRDVHLRASVLECGTEFRFVRRPHAVEFPILPVRPCLSERWTIRKRAQERRTPKPGGASGRPDQRASVVEPGGLTPLSKPPPHPERPQLPVPFIDIEPCLFSPLRLHLCPSFPLRSSRETKYRKISSYPSDPQRSSKHPSIGNSPPTVNAPPTLAKRLDCGSLLPLSNPTASPGTSPIACTSRPYRTLAFFSAAPALCPSFPLRSSRETKYRKKRKISDNPAVERFDLVGFAPIAPNCPPKPLPRQGTQNWTAEPQCRPSPI